jgi:hypothetical protein
MSTLIASIARAVRAGSAGLAGWRAGLAGWRADAAGWRAGAVAVPLLVAGALAAGCASAQSSGSASNGGPASSSAAGGGTAAAGGTAADSTAAGGTAGNAAPGHPTAPAAPTASATPVPTVSGGPVAGGGPACVGWPTGATSASLPVSFVPVSVERCVRGAQTIPGKGLWTTATLQRSDSDLTGLVNALRQPPATHRPGAVCPAVAVIPQQVVLIGANGQKLIPRLPSSGCGLTQSQVLLALNALRWQPVSVRLIAQIPTVSGSAPHSIQTVGGGVQPQ